MAIRWQNFNIAFFSDNQRPGLYVCTHLLHKQEFLEVSYALGSKWR